MDDWGVSDDFSSNVGASALPLAGPSLVTTRGRLTAESGAGASASRPAAAAASSLIDEGMHRSTTDAQLFNFDGSSGGAGGEGGLPMEDWIGAADDDDEAAGPSVSEVVKLASLAPDQLPASAPSVTSGPIRDALIRLLAGAGRRGTAAKRARAEAAPPSPFDSAKMERVGAPSASISALRASQPPSSQVVRESNAAAVTSTSGRSRWQPSKLVSAPWSDVDTQSFYDALQQFGTNFMLLAQLFPTRTRADILGKYKIEMRRNPQLIRLATAASNEKPIDLDNLAAKQHERARLQLLSDSRQLTDEERNVIQSIAEEAIAESTMNPRTAGSDGDRKPAASCKVGKPTHNRSLSAADDRGPTSTTRHAAQLAAFSAEWNEGDDPFAEENEKARLRNGGLRGAYALSDDFAVGADLDDDLPFDVKFSNVVPTSSVDDVPFAVKYADVIPQAAGSGGSLEAAVGQDAARKPPRAKRGSTKAASRGGMGSPNASGGMGASGSGGSGGGYHHAEAWSGDFDGAGFEFDL